MVLSFQHFMSVESSLHLKCQPKSIGRHDSLQRLKFINFRTVERNCKLVFICNLFNPSVKLSSWLLFSSKVDQMQDIVTGNPAVIRMVVHFNR